MAVEARGLPPDLDDELLALYFENRRRSGGGPLRSCRRRGSRACLVFENAEDAQRVLSRGSHVLQDASLLVRPMGPRDCRRVLLQGVVPQTGPAPLERYVERVLSCERGGFSVFRGRARDLALVQLQWPLSDAEFAALAEQVQHQALDGASIELDWVEQTDSVLVQGDAGRQLSQDLLELYFESKRGGGVQVQAVRLLAGGTAAVVTLEDSAAVEQVLQRPHQLLDGHLAVSPYYDFLEPAAEAEAGGSTPAEDGADSPICIPAVPATTRQLLQSELVLQELAATVPGCTLQRDGAGLRLIGGEAARQQEQREHVLAALRGVVQEHKPLSSWALGFLQREEVQGRLAELLAAEGVAACYIPAADGVLVAALQPSAARWAASLLDTFLCPLALPLSERQLPALLSPRWAQVQAALQCCQVRPAEDGQQLEGLTLLGLERENTARLEAFLQDCVPEEVVVPMEASALRFLQLYHHEVLAGITDVSLLPLEGADITGFRLSGEGQACQAAAELLQSLLCAVRTETVALELPGVRRFLLDGRGQAVVRELERRFRGVVGLERVCWHPPEAQHPLERSRGPLFLNCQRDPLPGPGQPWGSSGGAGEGSAANMEAIRGMLAALRPPATAAGAALPGPEEAAATEEGLFHLAPEQAEAGGAPASEEEEEEAGPLEGGLLPLAGPGARVSEEEEEAQLLLAIQQSMDSAWQEEVELRRAMALSLCPWSWRQPPGLGTDPPLPPGASPEVAHIASVVLCVSAEDSTAPLARELEGALRAQLREETVHHEALRTLPTPCHSYLAHLERKHAVRISRAGATATVHGFLDYPVAATRDLALLLARLLPAEAASAPQGGEGPSWVRWEAAGQGSPTPYCSQASALLEWAWRHGHRHLDVVFDERLFHIDFERMEEYDLADARAVPIGCTEACPAAPPAPSEEAKLVLLTEDSGEFQETVHHFCSTLEQLRNKISVVKVEKVLHPLLYEQFCLKKAAMERACGEQQVERLLFHGTTEQASREICQHGFNRSFCGRNGTRYGCGVYFATRAFLSVHEQYSPRSSDGSKFVFVARTLVGDYTRGSPSMRVPPLRDGDTAMRRYDSTVDNADNPSIFVIFNDTQAYPQYLLTCRWSQPR